MKVLTVPQSGSLAGQTASRNRFGQYMRTRAVPVNPNSTAQSNVRGQFSDLASRWATLSDEQRSGWSALGAELNRTDSLGQAYTLTGLQAYVSVNQTRFAYGDAVVDDPPVHSGPGSVDSLDIELADDEMEFSFTPTPLEAGIKLGIYASPPRSPGRSFESDLRLIAVSAAAAASPFNTLAAYQLRFGVPPTGQRIFFNAVLYRAGFLGPAVAQSAIVA